MNVKYGGKHVPKSPVKIDVKPKGDASKCKLKGPGLESPVVNEPTNFDVDCKRAGMLYWCTNNGFIERLAVYFDQYSCTMVLIVCYHVFAKYTYEGSIAGGGYIVDDENFSTVPGLRFHMCMIFTRDI